MCPKLPRTGIGASSFGVHGRTCGNPVIPTQTLVKRALEGDREAFALLVGRYERLVLGVAFNALGDFHAAQDIAQEAFVTAYCQLATLRNPAVFGPWVAQMTARLARKPKNRPAHHIPLNPDLQNPNSTTSWDRDEVQRVLSALNELPEALRTLMILRYVDGLDSAEIARVTQRPLGTVTKLISRALERLRIQLVKVQK
jgi:RNA polymerase sigma-70 factor (ECF subfamily)